MLEIVRKKKNSESESEWVALANVVICNMERR